MFAIEYDSTTGEFIADHPHFKGELPNNFTAVRCPARFRLPRFNGMAWIEGNPFTQAELDQRVIDGRNDNRRTAILEEWPVNKQLEALTEDKVGRPEKLNALVAHINQVKLGNP